MIRHCQPGTEDRVVEGREDRGIGEVGCGEGVPLPTWGGGCDPSRKNFSIFYLKTAIFGASGMLFFLTVYLPVLEAKTGAVGLKNLLLCAYGEKRHNVPVIDYSIILNKIIR